ncbi:hypothetical protein ACFL6I_19250 [candidate division KSB1 bacterium]
MEGEKNIDKELIELENELQSSKPQKIGPIKNKDDLAEASRKLMRGFEQLPYEKNPAKVVIDGKEHLMDEDGNIIDKK